MHSIQILDVLRVTLLSASTLVISATLLAVPMLPEGSALAAAPVTANVVNLYQSDFYRFGNDPLSPEVTLNSDWGQAEIVYLASSQLQYFNLVVDGQWWVKNAPLGAFNGIGNEASAFFSFGLGNVPGERVGTANYAFSVTQEFMATAPSATLSASVVSQSVTLSRGAGEPQTNPPPPPPPLVPPPATVPGGPTVVDGASRSTLFPNQQSGLNQCIPTAASNSLKYLNTTYKLGIADDLISIDTLSTEFGYNFRDGTRWTWTKWKDDYLIKQNIKILTIELPVIDDQIIKSIRASEDIELQMQTGLNGHVAAVVGAWKMSDGTYAIAVANDDNQYDTNKKTKIEYGYYNPTTRTMTGISMFEGMTLRNLVIESVPEPQTWAMMIIGFGSVGMAARRRRSSVPNRSALPVG